MSDRRVPIGRAYLAERPWALSGLSLVEVLVAMGLLSLIMVLLIQVLLPGLHIWKHARALADMEQQAMIAEDRIARALLTSISGSVASADTAALKAISMLGHGGTESVGGYDDLTGNPRWKQMEIFFVRPTDGLLYQTFWDGTGPSLPHDFADGTFALTPAQLIALCAFSGQRQRKVAEKVSDLTLVPVPDEETFLLTLSLTTAVPTGTRSITREVRLVPRMRERR